MESIRYVDLVISEENWEQKVKDIESYHVDTFVIEDDWAEEFDFISDQTNANVAYLERTPEISTTQIKNELRQT